MYMLPSTNYSEPVWTAFSQVALISRPRHAYAWSDFTSVSAFFHLFACVAPTRDAGVHANLTAKANRNGEIVQSKQEYEVARRSEAQHIPKKTDNSSLVCS